MNQNIKDLELKLQASAISLTHMQDMFEAREKVLQKEVAELRKATEQKQRTLEKLKGAQIEIIERLALAAEYRDDDTGEHAQRVGEISARLAHALGHPQEQVELLRRASPLHDVGKIGIPDGILLKRGKLSGEEFEIMKTHSVIGEKILRGGRFPLLVMAEEIALTHHERWNGMGYPQGLKGSNIPITGRIVAIADVYDALIHERPYKNAWSRQATINEIRQQKAEQFDPDIVVKFLKLMKQGDFNV